MKSVALMLSSAASSGSRMTSGVRSSPLEAGGLGCWAVAVGDPPLFLARRAARLLVREAVTVGFIHFAG